jgi:hypothetical protein
LRRRMSRTEVRASSRRYTTDVWQTHARRTVNVRKTWSESGWYVKTDEQKTDEQKTDEQKTDEQKTDEQKR